MFIVFDYTGKISELYFIFNMPDICLSEATRSVLKRLLYLLHCLCYLVHIAESLHGMEN